MKKRLLYILIVLFLLPIKVLAFDTVKPTDNFYVNDYANILSSETEKYIQEQSVSLNNETKAQIVVVTIKNLDGISIEDYANKLFRNFGIGDAKKNNGLLILLSLEDREVRVEVGGGLEGVLSDGKTGRMQDDYMIPYFKDDNFDEGMLNGYKAFFEEVAKEYNYKGNIDHAEKKTITQAEIISIIFTILFYALVVYLIVKFSDGSGSGGIYVGGGSSHHSSSRGFSGGGGRSFGGGSSRHF